MFFLPDVYLWEQGLRNCCLQKQRAGWTASIGCNWFILLGHSHAHLFTYHLWLFSCHNGAVAVTEGSWPVKPNLFTLWSFTEKNLLISTFEFPLVRLQWWQSVFGSLKICVSSLFLLFL